MTVASGDTPATVWFGNQYVVKFTKEFTSSGALSSTAPAISPDHLSSYVTQLKTGPTIWWVVTYTVTNKDIIGHYYIVWDKWGGNLMVLNSTPTAFDPVKNKLTLSDPVKGNNPFTIDYSGYSKYIALNGDFTKHATKGQAYVTLHTGDQQQGTNPGKGKGTSNDGMSYDLDLNWTIGYLGPGETATLTIIVAPGMNPGGQSEFTSTGINVINTGPVVRVYSDNTFANNKFLYTVPITNQLTVYVNTKPPWA